VELPNLFLQDMKRQYPLVFDLAVTVTTWLGTRLGVVLSEAEIGLIAVHIGSSYSRLERPWKARAILLAPQHYPLMQSSIDRLKSSFGHRLEILAQYDYVSEAQLLHQPVDLVISFMPLAQSLGLPILQVSTFFNEEDELALVSLLNQVEQRQTAIQLALQLGDFLESRFFYQDLQASSPEQVLTLMARDLAQAGYVTPDFLPSVLEREALSSTDFDYALAIPHPLQAHSHQSVLAIATVLAPLSSHLDNTPLASAAMKMHSNGSATQSPAAGGTKASSVASAVLGSDDLDEDSDTQLSNVPDAATRARIREAFQNAAKTCSSATGASGDTTAFSSKPQLFYPMLPGTYEISSEYGYRTHPTLGYRKLHAGQDMAAPVGTPIYAAAAGTVTTAGMVDGTGTITIKHEIDGQVWYTSYLHMYEDGIHVKVGDTVTAGQMIAGVGNTGRSSGSHLHFEVRTKDDTADESTVEPWGWLKQHNAVELTTNCS